jgi:hypothetical protein
LIPLEGQKSYARERKVRGMEQIPQGRLILANRPQLGAHSAVDRAGVSRLNRAPRCSTGSRIGAPLGSGRRPRQPRDVRAIPSTAPPGRRPPARYRRCRRAESRSTGPAGISGSASAVRLSRTLDGSALFLAPLLTEALVRKHSPHRPGRPGHSVSIPAQPLLLIGCFSCLVCLTGLYSPPS